MKKLLVTGGSHAEMPMIIEAKKNGWYVITTGNNEDGIGHLYADQYIPGDFSDKEFVYNLATREDVSAIISGCNDFAYLSTAYAGEKKGLKGHDSYQTACIIHHKDQFREFTNSLGIKTPKMMRCKDVRDLENACSTLRYPIYVKAVDLTGGKGIQKCMTYEEVQEAYYEAIRVTREQVVIAEECIQGTNHGVSVLLKDQKIVYGIVDNEQYYLNQYLVSGACSPSDLPEYAIFQLYRDIEKIAKELKLVDGLFHTQFILNHNQEPILIDPCRRAPGDLYVLLAKYVTGVNYPYEIVKAETGEGIQSAYSTERHFIARECIMSAYPGVIKKIHMDEEVKKHVIDQLIWGKSGDIVEDVLKYKAGILFMEFSSVTDMQKIVSNFHKLVTIEVSQ